MGLVRRREIDGETFPWPHHHQEANHPVGPPSPRSVSRMVSMVATPAMMLMSGQPHDGVELSSPRRLLGASPADAGTPVAFSSQTTRTAFAKPTLNLPASPGRDLGNLKIESLVESSFQRDIDPDDDIKLNFLMRKKFGKQTNAGVRTKKGTKQPDNETQCGETATWTKELHPTCNGFHEQSLDKGCDKYLGHGHFRDAWLVPSRNEETFVLKRLQLPVDDGDKEHVIDEMNLSTIQKEAAVMEHLTASPRIVDIYGHCGVSLMAESLPYSIPDKIVPATDVSEHTDHAAESFLEDSDILELALEMTKSIADLHGLSDAVVVHGDIHKNQWLKSSPDGSLKLNDFNSASILGYDRTSSTFCKAHQKGDPGSMFPAPEELQKHALIDEKIDIYNLGNSFYSLLTSREPPNAQRRNLRQEKQSYFDERIRSHGSPAIRKLVEITERMWNVEPAERPSVLEVIDFLSDAKASLHN